MFFIISASNWGFCSVFENTTRLEHPERPPQVVFLREGFTKLAKIPVGASALKLFRIFETDG